MDPLTNVPPVYRDDKAVADATSNLTKAAKAGQDVVAKCK